MGYTVIFSGFLRKIYQKNQFRCEFESAATEERVQCEIGRKQIAGKIYVFFPMVLSIFHPSPNYLMRTLG